MTLTSPALQFIDLILALRPRLAVFDCDGTLWDADSGEQFFYWELERSIIPSDVEHWARARYAEYRAGRVGEEEMCGEMVTIHRGIPCQLLEHEAAEFYEERIVPRIFPEMLELTRQLKESGCEMWAISSTNDWVVRAGVRRFGIAPERVIAACVTTENGCATDKLIRVPTDERKAEAIRELLPRMPDAVFGNSMHDFHMMELGAKAFAINPNPDLEKVACERGWTVYQPMKN
jgi:HAD superfamily phosphoserine phosphatase-like hydrolase